MAEDFEKSYRKVFSRLLLQYIFNYPEYLEVVPSIRNLKTCRAVETRAPLEMANITMHKLYSYQSILVPISLKDWNTLLGVYL
jgi:hypothetical protein